MRMFFGNVKKWGHILYREDEHAKSINYNTNV